MRAKLFAAAGLFAGLVSTAALAEPRAFGTGFAIGDGSIVVTANHVIQGCTDIRIPDLGSAMLLRSDPRSDLAILKPSRPLPAGLRFRSGHPVKLGEEIVVIGYPLRGLLATPPTVTTGIVSSLAGLRDDPTEMQISAPVQPGNSGGPVLDRAGNVIGIVEGKLNAIKAAVLTGDIPQNVNFAVQSPIVTALLDSYTINYDIGTFTNEKPIADIVAAVVPAVVVVECIAQETAAIPAPAQEHIQTPPQPVNAPVSLQTVFLCGRPVDYSLDQTGSGAGFLGVWSGSWNNSSRLCGGLIIEKVLPNGAAELIYVYGPGRPGGRFPWKEQQRTGFLSNDGKLSFQDDQGSLFAFDLAGSGLVQATFESRSGRLSGVFQKLR